MLIAASLMLISDILVVQTFIEKSISVVQKIKDINISWQDRNTSI